MPSRCPPGKHPSEGPVRIPPLRIHHVSTILHHITDKHKLISNKYATIISLDFAKAFYIIRRETVAAKFST